MRPDEIRATGAIAGEGFGAAVERIHETHSGIAERVFASIGPAAEPVQVMHDAISALAYGATRLIGRGAVRAGALGASLARRPDAPSLQESVSGRLAVGALSGAFGDRLAERSNALAVTMAVRRRGRDVEPTPAALAAAYPAATPRLAVFLHGLCETEDAWALGQARQRPYGSLLRERLGYTSLYVRYNSGRHISSNGRDLADLLEAIVAAWPVEVAEIALVGHSMGGLVARSACYYGAGMRWPSAVRHVFMLGTPHLGAPLERVAGWAAHTMARLPETRALATALNARSVGIKDLGHGYITDDDWSERDPDAFLRAAAREIPFLPGAHHYFISASLTRDHDHRFGRHIGDLLVLHASAWGHVCGQGEKLRFPVDHYRHIGGATHFDLLNHPAIGELLVTWIAGRPALAAGDAAA
jgi:hypothetical protein